MPPPPPAAATPLPCGSYGSVMGGSSLVTCNTALMPCRMPADDRPDRSGASLGGPCAVRKGRFLCVFSAGDSPVGEWPPANCQHRMCTFCSLSTDCYQLLSVECHLSSGAGRWCLFWPSADVWCGFVSWLRRCAAFLVRRTGTIFSPPSLQTVMGSPQKEFIWGGCGCRQPAFCPVRDNEVLAHFALLRFLSTPWTRFRSGFQSEESVKLVAVHPSTQLHLLMGPRPLQVDTLASDNTISYVSYTSYPPPPPPSLPSPSCSPGGGGLPSPCQAKTKLMGWGAWGILCWPTAIVAFFF